MGSIVGVDVAGVSSLIDDRERLLQAIHELEVAYTKTRKELMQSQEEYRGQISIQVGLKREIKDLIEKTGVAEGYIKTIENDNERQQHDLDASEHARQVAEARVTDLQAALGIERERFDKALDFEREADRGLRIRTGMLPVERKPGEELGPPPQAVNSRRARWSEKKEQIEREARQHADSIEQRWREKIAAVEEKDKNVSDDGSAAEGTGADSGD